MNQTQEQIEHLRTIQETSSFWADVAENQLPALADKIDNIDLSAVENKVQEESAAIQNKLDNLNVEVDLSSVAKQGSNADATNTTILNAVNNLYTSFDEMYAGQIKDLIGE